MKMNLKGKCTKINVPLFFPRGKQCHQDRLRNDLSQRNGFGGTNSSHYDILINSARRSFSPGRNLFILLLPFTNLKKRGRSQMLFLYTSYGSVSA